MKFGVNTYQFANYGAALPQLAAYVQTAEELGYSHVRCMDHVVGIVAERHGGIAATPYTSKSYLYEVFTLLAYLAALTRRIELVAGVLVLTQRQTTLAAKQAAQVDILSGGRLRLGVGVGYNPVEFETMNAEYAGRGQRFEEQIAVLRALWTQPVVNFEGRWHKIRDTSLSPLPLTQPIPLWFGMGRTIAPYPPDRVLERAGRLADGWMPLFTPGPEAEACKRKVHAAAHAAGRDPARLGLEMTLRLEERSAAQLLDDARRLRDFGASHALLRWQNKSPEDDLEVLKRFAGDVMAKF